jgi:uncharacterized membrane protein YcaP (DUF421 family)
VESWLAVDWAQVFQPDTSPLEIFVRGSIVYLALFSMLRLVLRREAGTVGMSDLLVLVLIADAAQNAMAGNYNSLPDGLLLVATIIFWSFALNWLGYHGTAVGRFVNPPPLNLVQDGRLLRRNMRRELISEDELMGQLRQQGIEDLGLVKKACMEGDGHISVIKYEDDDQSTYRTHKREGI